MTDKNQSDIKTFNNHIYDMLTKLTDAINKKYNQEEQLKGISCKLWTYEDHLNKMSTK